MRTLNLLPSKLCRFINGISITTQLLSYFDKCIDTIISGGVVETKYFDFAKEFNSVSQEKLLGKTNSNCTVSMVRHWNGLKLS